MKENSGYYYGEVSGDKRCSDFAIDDDHYEAWDEYFNEVRKPVLDSRKKDSCEHEWEQYHGFQEDFEYCSKCDIKREDL